MSNFIISIMLPAPALTLSPPQSNVTPCAAQMALVAGCALLQAMLCGAHMPERRNRDRQQHAADAADARLLQHRTLPTMPIRLFTGPAGTI